MRIEAEPHLIVEGALARLLARVKLGGTEIRENIMQELVDRNSAILPVPGFGESFGPIVLLGREILA